MTTILPPDEVGRGFRPDVEGLRAVAVLAVLAYHAEIPFAAGGYVGVDVFFVISGFLITRLLLAEIRRSGRVSLPRFYARRARRILPAAAVVLVATCGAALMLPPLRRHDLAWDVLACALQAGNWRFAAGQVDYLAASREPSALLHYWSLGVEEQFYLVWAPMLLVVAVLARGRVRSATVPIGVAVVALSAASFALSVRWTATAVPLAYLGSPPRAWEFGVGALVAVMSWKRLGGARPAGSVLGWAGLAAIGYATVRFGATTAFPGTAALVPALGTAAVLVAGAVPVRGSAGSLLATNPVRAIGRLSYSWYLWHWPVLVLAEAVLGDLTWPARLALVCGSALPAVVTMRLVEQPLRVSRSLSAFPRRGLAVGVTAILVPVAAGLMLGSGALRAMPTAPGSAGPLPPGALDGPSLFAATAGPLPTSGPVRPDPAHARNDLPPDSGCEVALTATVSPPCRFGDRRSAYRVVLLGDSHAGQWFSAVEYVARRRGWALEVLVKPGCPLAAVTVVDPRLGRSYHECGTWRENAHRRLATGPAPQLVIVAGLSRYGVAAGEMARGWDTTLGRLSALGSPIVYLRDTPLPARDVPACLSGALQEWDACATPRAQALPPDPLAVAVAARTWPAVRGIDLAVVLCPGPGGCPAVVGGIVLYRDDSHLTDTVVRILGPRLDREIRALGI